MFEDYQQLILQLYWHKKAAGQLPDKLLKPTVAKLKNAAPKAICRPYNRKDDKTLSNFIETGTDANEFSAAINKTDPDDFKTIYRWLRDEIDKTSDENVEFFAWLIDFEGQPFNPSTDYPELLKTIVEKDRIAEHKHTAVPKTLNPATAEKGDSNEPNDLSAEPLFEQNKGDGKLFARRLAIGIVVAIIFTIGALWLWQRHLVPAAAQSCMYWDGERYRTSSCLVKTDNGAPLIALGSLKQAHFRRIMRPDTLTALSIGKTWRVKIGSTIEYYTDSGYHPLYSERRLLKVTARTLDSDIQGSPSG